MRIGMILDKTFPPDPRVENEAISLIENGHEVFLFCLTYGNQNSEEDHSGIQVKRYNSTKFEYKMSALAYTFSFYKKAMMKKIESFVKAHRIEILHVHDLQIAEAALEVAHKCGIPKVLDLHENRPEIMQFYPHLQKFPGNVLIQPKTWKKKEELFVKKYDATIVVTQEAKEELLTRVEIPSEKIQIVPNTVRKSQFNNSTIHPEITEKFKDNFVLLYIGDTGLRRGLPTAIKSLPQLKKTIPEIQLVIVGTSTTDTVLKSLVRDLEVENQVSFEGWKDPETFHSYIEASSICISPLQKNLHHDTTYANKIFQYMSYGKPILVSDVLAQKNIVKHSNAGLVHKADAIQNFTEKVEELYGDSALRDKLGANGKQFVSDEFYWEKTSEKLIALYNNFSS